MIRLPQRLISGSLHPMSTRSMGPLAIPPLWNVWTSWRVIPMSDSMPIPRWRPEDLSQVAVLVANMLEAYFQVHPTLARENDECDTIASSPVVLPTTSSSQFGDCS
jgi:hypothetical protein